MKTAGKPQENGGLMGVHGIYTLVIKHGKMAVENPLQMEVLIGKSRISMVHFPARHVSLPEGTHLCCSSWPEPTSYGFSQVIHPAARKFSGGYTACLSLHASQYHEL